MPGSRFRGSRALVQLPRRGANSEPNSEPNPELRTENREPNPEGEHEPRSENMEPGTTGLTDVVDVPTIICQTRARDRALSCNDSLDRSRGPASIPPEMLRPRRLPMVVRHHARREQPERSVLHPTRTWKPGGHAAGAEGKALELIGRPLPTSERGFRFRFTKTHHFWPIRLQRRSAPPLQRELQGRWA